MYSNDNVFTFSPIKDKFKPHFGNILPQPQLYITFCTKTINVY